MWNKLEEDRAVYRNVSANTKADKGCNDKEGGVVVGCAKTKTEDAGEEASEIECPTTT